MRNSASLYTNEAAMYFTVNMKEVNKHSIIYTSFAGKRRRLVYYVDWLETPKPCLSNSKCCLKLSNEEAPLKETWSVATLFSYFVKLYNLWTFFLDIRKTVPLSLSNITESTQQHYVELFGDRAKNMTSVTCITKVSCKC